MLSHFLSAENEFPSYFTTVYLLLHLLLQYCKSAVSKPFLVFTVWVIVACMQHYGSATESICSNTFYPHQLFSASFWNSLLSQYDRQRFFILNNCRKYSLPQHLCAKRSLVPEYNCSFSSDLIFHRMNIQLMHLVSFTTSPVLSSLSFYFLSLAFFNVYSYFL